MAYALVQDIPASWKQYERLVAALVEPPPCGLIVHVAGPTEEGIRIIAVWESEHACRRFQAERLEQAIGSLAGPVRPRLTFRDLHPAHIVVGAAEPAFTASPNPKEEK